MRLTFACVFAIACPHGAAADSFTFADIEFWIGVGENRAALAIDWNEGTAEPAALVWGYRWSGAATGADMLTDILAADDRLFAKLGGSAANPIAVYGIGYDTDDDGNFTLDDGTSFSATGIAITSPADLAIATDLGDYYAEGWYTGFWHYGMAASNPFDGGQWADAPQGMAGRALADGAWDSWTYSPTFSFASFADNPQAAASPYPLGDFDRNGEVNGADYTHWKNQYGSTIDPSADGNGDGAVNAADYTVWRNQVAAMTSTAASVQIFDVPEPNGLTIALVALSFIFLVAQRRRRLAGGASVRYTRNAVPEGRHENSPAIYRIMQGLAVVCGSRNAAIANSQGRKPLEEMQTSSISPEGATALLLPPLRGFACLCSISRGFRPWLLTAGPVVLTC